MVPLAEIKGLALFDAMPPKLCEALAAESEEKTFESGELLVHQHDQARSLFVVLSGSVDFLMAVEGMDDLLVGSSAARGALIGWSVVREPYRYTATVRCREPCRAVRIPRASLDRVLREDPVAGRRVLEIVAAALLDRLEDARSLLGRQAGVGSP